MQLSTVLVEQTGPHCLGIRISHKPNVLLTYAIYRLILYQTEQKDQCKIYENTRIRYPTSHRQRHGSILEEGLQGRIDD